MRNKQKTLLFVGIADFFSLGSDFEFKMAFCHWSDI